MCVCVCVCVCVILNRIIYRRLKMLPTNNFLTNRIHLVHI